MATKYVTQDGYGVGADGTYEKPYSIAEFNAESGGVWVAAGNTIYLLGDFTTAVVVPASGASGNFLTIRGDYAGRPCVIDGQLTLEGCFDVPHRSHVHVVGCTAKNPAYSGFCLYATSSTALSNVIFEDCIAYGANSSGARVDKEFGFLYVGAGDRGTSSAHYDYRPICTGIVWKNCYAYDNGAAGFETTDAASPVGTTGFSWINCTGYNNGTRGLGGNFLAHPSYGAFGYGSWTKQGATDRYQRSADGGASPAYTLDYAHVVRTTGSPPEILTKGTFGSCTEGQWAYSSGDNKVEVYLAGGAVPDDNLGAAHQPCVFEWNKCISTRARDNASGHGHGFMLDVYVSNSKMVGCVATGSDSVGFYLASGIGNKLDSCIAVDNAYTSSANRSDFQLVSAQGAVLSNCVAWYTGVSHPVGTYAGFNSNSYSVTLNNCIAVGHSYNYLHQLAGTYTLNNCGSYGHTVTGGDRVAAGTSSLVDNSPVTTNPSLNSTTYYPASTAYHGTGLWVAGVRAYDDLPLPLHPDIGAVQDRTAPGRRFGVGGGKR